MRAHFTDHVLTLTQSYMSCILHVRPTEATLSSITIAQPHTMEYSRGKLSKQALRSSHAHVLPCPIWSFYRSSGTAYVVWSGSSPKIGNAWNWNRVWLTYRSTPPSPCGIDQVQYERIHTEIRQINWVPASRLSRSSELTRIDRVPFMTSYQYHK